MIYEIADCSSLETVKAVTGILGLVTAAVAILVYVSNSRLERAKWLAKLYEKFYEQPSLKGIRDALDCRSGESPNINHYVKEEPSEFTDYLNFFEFVAVLRKSRQLRGAEIEGLFGFYLDCLEKSREVRNYIADKSRGYEELNGLLRKRVKKSE